MTDAIYIINTSMLTVIQLSLFLSLFLSLYIYLRKKVPQRYSQILHEIHKCTQKYPKNTRKYPKNTHLRVFSGTITVLRSIIFNLYRNSIHKYSFVRVVLMFTIWCLRVSCGTYVYRMVLTCNVWYLSIGKNITVYHG